MEDEDLQRDSVEYFSIDDDTELGESRRVSSPGSASSADSAPHTDMIPPFVGNDVEYFCVDVQPRIDPTLIITECT